MRLLVALVPPGGVVIDVGCDHGLVAGALDAIGVEREPHRLPAHPGRFVVADGLAPFHPVQTAVLAGMGPATVLGILDRGPRPQNVVIHCPDGMDRLRQGLCDRSFAINAEGLAREGDRISEVVRASPGLERHRGHTLWFGPLLEQDPLVEDLATQLYRRFAQLFDHAPVGTSAHERAQGWLRWLDAGRPESR
jgi:tRNA A22 N-methylase